ncbi:MAG: hypothetical protein ACI9XJ_001959 [Marivirga sp.]|jgi:hypothetical protein
MYYFLRVFLKKKLVQMNKYLLPSLIILLLFSFDSHSQISFQSLDTIQYNTDDLTDARLVDLDLDGVNEIIYTLDNKIYSIKDFQDNSAANKSLIFEDNNLGITSFSNFVDYNNDGFLDFAIIAFDNTSFLSSVIFIKGSENGFIEDLRKEANGVFYVDLIDFDQDGSFEIFYSTSEKFGYLSDWENALEGFDLEFQQESVNGIKAVDYDNDGELEIVGSGSNSFHIYDILESGEVDLVYASSTDFTPNTISYGDINIDGFTDFIYRRNDEIYSLIYDGGQFIENNLTEQYNIVNIRSPKLIDIDQNNTLDLVFRDALGRLNYFENQGGNLNQLKVIGETEISNINNILLDDFDKDGFIDLLVYDNGVYDLIYIDQNQEIREISSGEFYDQINDIVSLDLDNDGKKDLITISKYGAIKINYEYKNNLDGEGSVYPIQRDSDNLNIYDVDDDGILDIIYYESDISGGNSVFYVLKGLGNREFQEPVQWKYLPNGNSLIDTDLNNDGIKELVTFRSFGTEFVILRPNSGIVNDYFNADNVLSIQNGNGIKSFDIGDVLGDGSEDIVSANFESQNISILTNDGTGSFSESTIEVGLNVNAIKIFDYDFDGKYDLLITTRNENEAIEHLQVYLNDGPAGFTFTKEFILDTYNAVHIDIIDLDNDGDNDILVSGETYLSQEVIENIEGNFELVSVDIENSDQVYRIFDDIDRDGRIDFYSKHISFGNTFIHYNNSVSKPSIDDFDVNILEMGYSNTTIVQSALTASGYLVLLKEDSSSILNERPEDNSFYASNASFGNGGQIDGAFVVYSGNAASFEISGLKVSSNYKLFAFPYNSNSPNNTLIQYADDYISLSVATDSSIYILLDLLSIEVDEDSSTELDLTEYIFDAGINTYTASVDVEEVELSIESNLLKIVSLNDFNGVLEIEVLVENEYEERSYVLQLLVNAVNDAPLIQESNAIQKEGLEATFVNLQLYDVDNSIEELTIKISSSNNDIIQTEEIEYEVIGDSIRLDFTPLDLGTSNITLVVSDLEFEVSSEFTVEIIEIVLSNMSELEGFSLFPNPVSDMIYFENRNVNTAYRIFTLKGKVVKEGKNLPKRLDVKDLEEGIYIFEVGNYQVKFIKR